MNISNTKILYAVLNWGLGHASRSIPIINQLIANNNEVVVASSGAAGLMLRNSFPNLTHELLPDYNVKYRTKSLMFNALSQFVKVNRNIRQERMVVENLVEKLNIQLIISDNALGAYCPKIESILISHQISLPSKHFRFLIDLYYSKFLKPFSKIWIPDFEGLPNLSGNLSHNPLQLNKKHFIGPQSRFKNLKFENDLKIYELTFVLSGPEPARSVFENQILRLLEKSNYRAVLVRGTFEPKTIDLPNLDVFDFLDDKELLTLYGKTKWIISRSGYSSLMDFYFLNIPTIIIPTPGQPEQEYLADYHKDSSLFHPIAQDKLCVESINAIIQSHTL